MMTQAPMFRPHAPLRAPILFNKSHEWIDVQGDGTATLGISDFAQSELGDIVYVDLPEVGTKVTAGESYAAVESVKTTDEVFTPVDGVVLEVNEALNDEPELVNKESESGGWFIKLKEISAVPAGLMQKDAYEKFVAEGQ
jgi:glycine cleavage system H protein